MDSQFDACRFCGQIVSIQQMPENYTGGAEEYASRHCKCDEAVAYDKARTQEESRIRDLENICARIRDIFGEQAKRYDLEPVPEEVQEILADLSTLVYDDVIHDATVGISEGVKAKIGKAVSGKFRIVRSDANKIQQEV